jgi:hypothetical protein
MMSSTASTSENTYFTFYQKSKGKSINLSAYFLFAFFPKHPTYPPGACSGVSLKNFSHGKLPNWASVPCGNKSYNTIKANSSGEEKDRFWGSCYKTTSPFTKEFIFY